MRKDIVKIVREEARHGSGDKFANYRHKKSFNSDESATRESMRVRYSSGWHHKSQHYSFTAILNFIRGQIGRPWNDIYSEICEQFPAKHYMRKSVDDFLRWEIEQVHYDEAGKPYTLYRWYGNERKYLADGHVQYYIDDKGIFRKNKHYQSITAMLRKRTEAAKDKRFDTLRIIDKHNVLRKIGDFWYHFKLKPLKPKFISKMSYWDAKNDSCCSYRLPYERINALNKLPIIEQRSEIIIVEVSPTEFDEYLGVKVFANGINRASCKRSHLKPNLGADVDWWDLYQGVHYDKKAASHQLLKKHKII